MSTTRVTAAVAGVVVLLGAGWVTADAYDVVPGVVTLDAPYPPPVPFPTAPGAVEPPGLLAGPPEPTDPVPLPEADELRALADAVVAHRWIGESVGIVVADGVTGEVLVDVGGATPREPASTAKLLTAVAATSALGPDATVETRVVQQGPGRIVLVGGGDVMLAAGAGDPDAINGRAGLADLADDTARALALAGTTEVTLALDDTLFSGPDVAPGWTPGDLALGYMARVSPIAVNIAKTREEPYPPRHADPSMHAATTFAALLRDRGVTVVGEPARATAPASAVPLASVRSATVREVVRYLLHTSDNTVTEVVGRLVALDAGLPGSFQGATRAVLAEVRGLGVDVEGAVLADCSGLAEGSALPTSLLVDLMRVADADAQLRGVLVDLPVAGWQGTLGDRYGDLPARGLVRAKTGSLVGVTSLAGTVVTQQGRHLLFAVVADRTPPGGQLGPRRVVDAFVQQLAGCACGLP
ncbi:D-alanyl-D-alanine carboxypeptidase/D-alanyl-D-alanine endopeptidase [Cellulomonas carbonis]|uniref:D-alanyl-D-alanine carboxypeptidase n=1 Tax=Cellulomonas carbonis T26 TaxID=947969 RepID=A0A0A0BL31_9CELL|nr:D-alanyl-D-alanine carboxypeptidase/D-alanyl-D-alanine-endopeptidase [Cellulomonas carbonis]KGM08676.1 D-alanyl-D-alanine carboxypeptidase [Cellulomonas carbonis T26]GGC04873.1 D-alanyl-D-alanine carboxypeptidase [Cellulomonas carbonis]